MYCVIDETADEPIMMLDRHIGMDADDGMGIDGAYFARSLLSLDGMGKKTIQVYINCIGGNVIDGMNIVNAILKSKTPVDTHNVGIAASMGGVIFMTGRKRSMADYASLMVHNPSGSDDKDAIAAFTNSISTLLSAKSGLSKDEVGYLMSKESRLNSAECFAKGFCTDISVTSTANQKRMPVGATAKAMYNAAKEITNNLFNTNSNTSDMKQVTAKLGLIEGANEASHVAAIDKITNDAAEALRLEKEKREKAEKDFKEANDKIIKLEADAAGAKKITDDAKVITDAKAKTELEGKAKTAVTAAVKIGKIKNDAKVIAAWEKLFTDDFDGTTGIVNDLPLNRTAGNITDKIGEIIDNAEAVKSGGTAAGIMLAIQNKTANGLK